MQAGVKGIIVTELWVIVQKAHRTGAKSPNCLAVPDGAR